MNPKGHRSWLDAIGPTASRVAATEIEYSSGAAAATAAAGATTATAIVGTNGIPRPHMNRSLLQNSPTKSSSSKGSPSVGGSPSVPSSPFERDTESSAQRKAAAAATKFHSKSNSIDQLLSTDTPSLKTSGSTGSGGGGGGGDDGQNKNETNSLTYTTATEQTGNSFRSPSNAKDISSSIVVDSPKVNQSPSTDTPIVNQSPTINTPVFIRSQSTYSIQVDDDSQNDDTNHQHFQTCDSPMTLQSGAAQDMNFTFSTSPRKKKGYSFGQTTTTTTTTTTTGVVHDTSSKKRFSSSGTTGGSLVLNPQSRYPSSTTKYNYTKATASTTTSTVSKGKKDIINNNNNSSSANDPYGTVYKETTIIDDSQQQQQQQQQQYRREDPLSAIRRVPIISARSEEAMRKHQVYDMIVLCGVVWCDMMSLMWYDMT